MKYFQKQKKKFNKDIKDLLRYPAPTAYLGLGLV